MASNYLRWENVRSDLSDSLNTAAITSAELTFNALSMVVFTRTEREEIGHMIRGLTVGEASYARSVQCATTNHHRQAIRKKLGARNAAQATNALCLNFVVVPPFPPDLALAMDKLTPVEHWELEMAAQGYSAREAAQLREVSIVTVRRHRRNLIGKRMARCMVHAIFNEHRLQAYRSHCSRVVL